LIAPIFGAAAYPQTPEEAARGIVNWERAIGVWEDDAGRIVAVVHGESDGPGRAFMQRRAGRDDVLDSMIGFAERSLAHPDTGRLSLYVPDGDWRLRAAAVRRGYEVSAERAEHESQFDYTHRLADRLPDGFCFRSMADSGDVEPRRKAMGLGFDHTDPGEWVPAFCYRELQRAPGYRPDLDVCIVAPDGEYVASCIGWHDERNQIGGLEPVCTIPPYRRRGLGREVVYEVLRRLAAAGARTVWVGTDMPFYIAIGFRVRHAAHYWQQRQ
jgi:ribosomal protein S18 acetylase RimI-like enzyme